MISANVYCAASKLKRAQVFAVFIRNLKFKATKRLNQRLIQKVLNQKSIIIFWMFS